MHLHYLDPMIRSRITSRSQTTIPRGVREALGIRPGQDIGYIIEGGEVRVVNATHAGHDDPVVRAFLKFLEQDLREHPEHVETLPASLVERARALTRQVRIDHDAPIQGAVSL
jgi:antitoxin PrlF